MIERLGDEVRRELGRFGPIEGDTAAIVRAWPRAVGETVARNAWPARIGRDGTLHVNAASATWAFELGRLAETILAQLRAELGDATPRTLKFAPGPVPGPRADAATVPAAAPEIAAKHSADAAEIAAGIEDDELRRLVARAAAASLANAHREPPDDRGF